MSFFKVCVCVENGFLCKKYQINWVINLGASGFTGEQFTLFVGVDADDLLWRDVHRSQAEALLKAASITMVEVTSPAEQPRGAVCTVWDRLARVAVLEHECDGLLILFGDDVRYAPKDKIDDVWTSLSAMPGGLGLAQPCDATDLSCCTFPIMTAAHVHLFGQLLCPRPSRRTRPTKTAIHF